MKRTRVFGTAMLLITLAFIIPSSSQAEEAEPFKWYGVGGELNGMKRWMGRLGITQHVGAEMLFGIDWESDANSDYSLGAGVIYDYAPTAEITPYTMCRFILRRVDNGNSKTSIQLEAGGGVEYVIKKRVGISAELNFNFSFDPARMMTTTLLRAYFYL
jgi:opacity protein-like surface antigen